VEVINEEKSLNIEEFKNQKNKNEDPNKFVNLGSTFGPQLRNTTFYERSRCILSAV
jgi:hypothetical protein